MQPDGGGGDSRPAWTTAHPGSHDRSQQDSQRKSDVSAEDCADGTAVRWKKIGFKGEWQSGNHCSLFIHSQKKHLKAFRKMFYEEKSRKQNCSAFRTGDNLEQG